MYFIFVAILKLLVGWKFDINVEGLNNIPQKGPLLIIFNHNDHTDIVSIVFPIRRKMTAMVAKEWGNHPLVRLFALSGAVILVKRGLTDKIAMKKALSVLNNNGILVVAPEGTRGDAGTLGSGKFGPAYLAGITNTPIIAVGIEGTRGGYKKLLNGLFSKKKLRIIVRIGSPFYLKVDDDLKAKNLGEPDVKNKWQEITNVQMMPQIAKLLPKYLRGNY